VLPEWNLPAVIYILPVTIVPAIEHFGDILAIVLPRGTAD